MQTESTLLFNRSDVQELLSLAECIDAVEKVFHRQGEGKIPPSGILGVRTQTGGLHVKTACLSGAKKYIVAKLNTNFPQNYARFGKPTIQGVIVLYDADNGRVLAVLDSMEITINVLRPRLPLPQSTSRVKIHQSRRSVVVARKPVRNFTRFVSSFHSEKFTHSILIQAHRCISLHNYRANFR